MKIRRERVFFSEEGWSKVCLERGTSGVREDGEKSKRKKGKEEKPVEDDDALGQEGGLA